MGQKLEVITKYGSPFLDLSVEFSPEVVDFFNSTAEKAENKLEGEWVPLEPNIYLAVGIPTVPVHVGSDYLALHNALRMEVDDVSLDLGDFPRFFSYSPHDTSLYRHGPVWVPLDVFPDDFPGRMHTLSLYQDDELICGPFERMMAFRPPSDEIATFERIEGGDQKLHVTISNIRALNKHRDEALRPWMAFFTSPDFGEPIRGVQIHEDGHQTELKYDLVGKDFVGDTELFNEAVLWGPNVDVDDADIELELPSGGTGLAMVLGAGHSKADAFRVGVTVE